VLQCVTMPTARYLATRKMVLKLLRIEIENYSHHHDNGNVSNRTSMGIDLKQYQYHSDHHLLVVRSKACSEYNWVFHNDVSIKVHV
jgi:hypothetical protein